ncbi:MAG: hypothetical protein ABI988_13625 [Nitrospirota bacterium]
MTRARILQEVRRMRLEELYARRQQRQLTIAGVGTSMPRGGGVAGWAGSASRTRIGEAQCPWMRPPVL